LQIKKHMDMRDMVKKSIFLKIWFENGNVGKTVSLIMQNIVEIRMYALVLWKMQREAKKIEKKLEIDLVKF